MSQTLLLNSLVHVRRRVRLLSAVHGLGYLLAAIVGLLIATVFLDYLLNLPPVPRIVLMLAAVVCAGWVFVRFTVRPLMSRLRIGDVAGRIEQSFPVFEDRLRSAVDFSRSSSNESESMKRRVVEQAENLAGEVNLQSVVRPQPAMAALAAGIGSALICLLIAWMVGPDYLSAAMSRLLTPFEGRAWPKWTRIEVVGDLPARVAAGTPVEVKIRLAKGDRPSAKAIVFYRYEDGGPVQQELMTRNPDGTYTASLDARLDPGKTAGEMSIWMRSGDDSHELPPVKVLPPLTIRDVEAVVWPPKYADQVPATLDLAAAPASLTIGSTVELHIGFSKPLAAGKQVNLEMVSSDVPTPDIKWDASAGDANTAVGRFIAKETTHFRVVSSDQDGFTNSGIEEYQILAHPDQLPSVQFEKPVRNEETTADAAIPIQAVAEDDFGIKTLQMMVRRLKDNQSWTINLIDAARPATSDVQWRKLDGTGDRLRFRMNWDWNLPDLANANLKAGDQLEFYLRVQDNFVDDQGHPHNPPYSESGRLRVTIISQDQLNQQLADQLTQLRAQVEETRRQNEATRSGTRGLQQDTQNKLAFDRSDRTVAGQLANDQSAEASQTKQIADRLGEMQARMQANHSPNNEMANNVAEAQRLLNSAAENPMQNAATRLAQMSNQPGTPQTDQPNNEQAGQPQDNQEQNQSANQNPNGNQQNGNQQNGNQQNGNQQSGDQQTGNPQTGNQQTGNQQSANQQNAQQGGQQGQQQSGQQNSQRSGQQNGQQSGQQNGQQSGQQSGQQGPQQPSGQQSNQQSGQRQQPQSQPPASAAQRNQALAQVQQQQSDASDQLQKAMDRMGQDAGLSQYLKQVADLLDQQRKLSNQTQQTGRNTLGKDPTQLSDQDQKNLQNLADQQRELARQTDQAMNQMNKAADQQQRSDQPTSQALRQAAQTAQDQNVSGQMNQAAQAEQQNQQADAQQAQKQSEIGLMMVLNQLKDAENRRLMELMKQLETAQELVGDLLEQQAGHNLDNLGLQGPAAMADAVKTSADLVHELADYANRDADHLPDPPPLATLVSLQEQTERNTRSVIPVVQALPNGSDAADELTRADQRMSRAAADLEEAKLTDAYQPPQVEAFAALLSAKQELDKQSEQARQQMQDQRKETLRQQFQEIRDQQFKLNEQTKQLDASPRTADGQFGHAARANLGIASDQQGALAKTVAKLDDVLTGVGSVSYVYVNDDIASRMTTAGASLGKLDPGTATQKTQARVVEELDDMIKNLSMHPKQSNFSNPRNQNAGQGQGQGQQQNQPPRLPPEAEIRLIQDMQKMLNQDTKDADAATPIDKPTVLDLGKRQGDLRKLLDDLLKKASNGQASLGPEPENKATLPEEATDEDLDLQELKDTALNAKPDDQGIKDDTSMVGIRMTRARQRLALDADPGKTTQKIQDRIVIELDGLANMAQQQEQTASSPSRQRGQQQRQQRPGQEQQGQQPGNQLAQGQRQQQQANNPNRNQVSNPGGNTAGLSDQDINAQVAELKESWGKLSPRQRAAVMEGASDQTLQKFKDFVDGYYRTLAARSAQTDNQGATPPGNSQ